MMYNVTPRDCISNSGTELEYGSAVLVSGTANNGTSDMWDNETDYAAALVPRFTGGLSAISSALIIYVILRSQTRLSSIYHRIMFGMSLADICGSIAMALTSLPMPSSMPKEEIFGYHWDGALGNTYTCNAQGFFAMFGMVCMFNYNAMLCVYYACAIAFTMRETNIKKYVEPIFHALPMIVSLSFSLPPLFYDMYNPGISAYAWCGPVTYPNTCGPDVDIECIRGNADIKRILQIVLSVVMTFVFILIFFPLTMVIWKVIQTDRIMTEISKLYKERGYEEMQQVLSKQRNTKAVLLQAVSYIVAFLLGAIPPLLLAQRAVTTVGKSQDDNTGLLERLTLVFLPLQGFFNFIIFVSHKVYNYRQVHHDTSVCRVMNLLFCTSSHDPFFISRMFIVKNNEEDEFAKNFAPQDSVLATNQVYNIDIRDESNEELHYRLGLMNRADILSEEEEEDAESHTKSMSIEETCSLMPSAIGNNKCGKPSYHDDYLRNPSSNASSTSSTPVMIHMTGTTSTSVLCHMHLSTSTNDVDDVPSSKMYYR